MAGTHERTRASVSPQVGPAIGPTSKFRLVDWQGPHPEPGDVLRSPQRWYLVDAVFWKCRNCRRRVDAQGCEEVDLGAVLWTCHLPAEDRVERGWHPGYRCGPVDSDAPVVRVVRLGRSPEPSSIEGLTVHEVGPAA